MNGYPKLLTQVYRTSDALCWDSEVEAVKHETKLARAVELKRMRQVVAQAWRDAEFHGFGKHDHHDRQDVFIERLFSLGLVIRDPNE